MRKPLSGSDPARSGQPGSDLQPVPAPAPACPRPPRCRGWGDVGVVEAGEDLRLPREPGEAVGVRREGVGEDLQGDLAVELRVGGLPDLAHAALPDEGGDVVVAEANASTEGHGLLVPRIGSFYAEAVHRLQRPAQNVGRGPVSQPERAELGKDYPSLAISVLFFGRSLLENVVNDIGCDGRSDKKANYHSKRFCIHSFFSVARCFTLCRVLR